MGASQSGAVARTDALLELPRELPADILAASELHIYLWIRAEIFALSQGVSVPTAIRKFYGADLDATRSRIGNRLLEHARAKKAGVQ